MSQSRKKGRDRRVTEQTADKGQSTKRRTGIIIASILVALILIIGGFSLYGNYIAPFQRTIISVDDVPVSMDYFLKRTRLAGADPMEMLEILTQEMIIRQQAPLYGITVSEDDILQELRTVARGDSESISEREFEEWYRQQLNESELSEDEYRELITLRVMTIRLYEYLAERAPTVATQLYLHGIRLENYRVAQKTRERWQNGENFTALAQELSLDEEAKERGGEIGWIPRGILGDRIDGIIFAVEPGEVTIPIPVDQVPTDESEFYLFLVSERAESRELSEGARELLKLTVLDEWLMMEQPNHKIVYTFNSEIDAWIKWQLSKTKSSSDETGGGQ